MIEPKEIHIVPKLIHRIGLQKYRMGIFNRALTKSALKKVTKKEYITINKAIATMAPYIKRG